MKAACLLLSVLVILAIEVSSASDRTADCERLAETVREKASDQAELRLAVAALDGFCAQNPDLNKLVLETVKKQLALVKDPNQRANLFSALIDSESICRDQRQTRQWLDDLEELLEDESLSPDCRCRSLKSIGGKEFWSGNLVEAEGAFCQFERLAEEQKNDLEHVEALGCLEFFYICKGNRAMSEHIAWKKEIVVRRLASCPDAQAEAYADSALNCALLREWSRFDELCVKSVAADGGKKLCRSLTLMLFANMNAIVGREIAKQVALEELKRASCPLGTLDDEEVFAAWIKKKDNESRYIRNMENNFVVADFVRKTAGGGFSLLEFYMIMAKLCELPCRVLADEMGGAASSGAEDERGLRFLFDLLMAEMKISKGVPYAEVRDELNRLTPVPFDVMQTNFSVDDARSLLLQVRMCLSQRMGDLAERVSQAQEMNRLLAAVSKPFLSLAEDDCKARIAEVWIDQGKLKEGYNLLMPIAVKLLQSDAMVDVMVYYNLGRACRRLGALGDAERLLSRACRFVRPFGYIRPFRYQGTLCYYGPDVCTEYAILSAEKHANPAEVDALVEMAISQALRGGHSDALGRAYQEAMKNLFKNTNVSRKEKLAKIEKMKADCLAATSNPVLLASFFYNSARFEYDNNMSAKKIVKEIEQYFYYQQLFAEDSGATDSSAHEAEMKEMLLTLLGEMEDVAGLDYWNKAFEKRKTRSVEIASITASKDSLSNGFLPILLQVAKHEAATEILKREQAKPEEARDAVLLAKATEIKRELERNFDDARKNLPPDDAKVLRDLLADSFVIHPDSMDQLCSVLPDDVLCLQFLVVGEKIIVYAARKGATPFVTTIQLKDKGLTARQLNQSVVKLRSRMLGAGGKALLKDLQSLYNIVFADIRPAVEKLRCRRVIVNSSGMLRYVPFAALHDGEKYLIERYQISNVTGLDLIRLAKEAPSRNADSLRAMVFADPDGTLPSGREEGRRVAGMFRNSRLLIGEDASLANFETMTGPVNFIHLATHAVLDPDRPRNSFILFANGRPWRYCDMMGFCVENVDSIALSACSTAVGEKSNGEEIEGMVYQLLRKSPSGSVLASFWKVDDAATATLMSTYYRHISKAVNESGSLDRGGALHEAQLALLHDPKTSSPYYWAAFSLFGDFR